MKLTQTGPDINSAGELISQVVAESSDIEFLRQEGYRIADTFNVKDIIWVQGPLPSKHLSLEIRQHVFLGIDP